MPDKPNISKANVKLAFFLSLSYFPLPLPISSLINLSKALRTAVKIGIQIVGAAGINASLTTMETRVKNPITIALLKTRCHKESELRNNNIFPAILFIL